MLTVGSLFSGIGGIDLGLERAGMRTLWQVEIDEWCQDVLAKHWPDVERHSDVKEVGGHNLSPVDLIAGGFPCQDISNAGKRAGILGGTRSFLWFEFARIVRELRPRYVLVENVAALRLRGRGFDVVLAGLAEMGYVGSWCGVEAAAFGAPHLRERVFLVAYSPSERRRAWERRALPQVAVGGWADALIPSGAGRLLEDSDRRAVESWRRWWRTSEAGELADANGWRREVERFGAEPDARSDADGCGEGEDVADAEGERGELWSPASERSRRSPSRGSVAYAYLSRLQGHGRPIECPRELTAWADGVPIEGGRIAPPGIRRVAHGIPRRVDRLRGLGNAVVPQVVEWVGRLIAKADEELSVEEGAVA